MFGDPISNSKKWDSIRLSAIGEWKTGGTPLRSNLDYFKGNIPWLSSGELNNKYCFDSNEHITEDAIKNSSAKLIEKESLLLGMYDTAALKSTINMIECTCNQAIAYSKLNNNIVNTIYVYYCIQQGKQFYKNKQRGVRQKNLNLTMIKNLEIIMPPIELQNQFADFVKETDKLKHWKFSSGLKVLINGFNSLIHEMLNSKSYMFGEICLKKDIEEVYNKSKEYSEKLKGGIKVGNFDFLRDKKIFESFASSCIEAEKSIVVSPATTAILSRRALELAVKWLYSFDNDLVMPYQDNLSSLIHNNCFCEIIDNKLFKPIKYIISLGNVAVHTNSNIKREDVVLSLHNLHMFVSWIDYCYSDNFTAKEFDENLLLDGEEKRTRPEELEDLYEKLSSKDKKIEEIRKENENLRKKLTAKRKESKNDYNFNVDEITEYETRKKYIDIELKLAGWEFDKNIVEEEKVDGMPNNTGIGFADYVLYGKNGKPLAVVEAKRTSKDPKIGQQQAKLYADSLEKKHGQRPIIFFTNGFEIYIWDDFNNYSERKVYGFRTQDELQLMVDRRSSRKSLSNITIKDSISNRYYQKEAIIKVCEDLEQRHRKFLLVMATGTGKTRTAISLVDVLSRNNWIKNVLFLADRKALVKQAKNNFSKLLPNLSLCNLLDSRDNPEESRMIFSTYPTMMNAIDDKKSKDGRKLFTPGHFDLIIIDESHRSIYKKYKAIFDYFDAYLLGLTATPKDEVDKNTYSIFNLESGVPTYAYELEKAVEDKYLVDYETLEYESKLMKDGIKYEELSDEDKEQYENTFDDDENIGDEISSSAINEWLFNEKTIDLVLEKLMERGLRIKGNEELGKTIIFAKNNKHAKVIVDRFNKIYPELGADYCKEVDYSIKYVDSIIDDFSEKDKKPQIAVSVDMLDTGIDIPEVLNLVFFKKVRSKSKFWQMIGRGTRLCPCIGKYKIFCN